MPIWWRRARFSSSRAARERRIEDRVARAVLRKMSIGGENYERSIIPLRSETSRFSRGTGAANAVNWSSSHFSDRTLGASRHAPFEVTLRRRVSAPVRRQSALVPRLGSLSPFAQSAVGYLPAALAFPSSISVARRA